MCREIYNLMACNTESLDRIKLLISLTHYFATSFGFLYLAIAVTQVKQTTLYTIKLLLIACKIYHFRGIEMLNFRNLSFYMSKSTSAARMCRLKIKVLAFRPNLIFSLRVWKFGTFLKYVLRIRKVVFYTYKKNGTE